MKSCGGCGSAKREVKGLNARRDKFDFEHPIRDGLGLSNQLIHPRLAHSAIALIVNIDPVSGARRLTIDSDAEPDCRALHAWPHDEIEIARMEAIHNSPTWGFETGGLGCNRPVTHKRPLVEP